MAKPTKQSENTTPTPPAEEQKVPVVAGKEAPLMVAPGEPTGLEAMPTDRMVIPRIKLMQGVSKELDEFQDLRKGQFFHTIAKIGLSTPLRIMPVHMRTRFILWRPQWDGGGIIARADDGKNWDPPEGVFEIHPKKDDPRTVKIQLQRSVEASRLAKFGTSDPKDPNSQPLATRVIDVIVLFPDHLELGPTVYSFQRSSERVGNEWHTRQALANRPIYQVLWNLGSKLVEKKKDQAYLEPTVNMAGFADGDLKERGRVECLRFLELAKSNLIDVGADEDEDQTATTGQQAPGGGRNI